MNLDESPRTIDHQLSQTLAAELYLSHFCAKDDPSEYRQSLMDFISSWCQLKLCRNPEDFIPAFSR